ncbi:nucleotidyltransferase domain-containing protein [Parabacteroides sp. OttesenSCG-928-G07]|nr:nucleotidyltransferase domain-containing protein [Parabacteroides sp. OttesenSCG-928-G21]MDL2277423.1 nucleotidyltransferase domain-containing protein [Parabacteroides sp. OttesenSCG-928-G07]
MNTIEALATKNQQRGWEIIEESSIYAIWESIGAEVFLVGSLPNGLMMKKRDIDVHVYTESVNITDSFTAITRLAEKIDIYELEYRNLLDTEEECVEWHATFYDVNRKLWKFDIIHIRKGSLFDGHVERVTGRIKELLTPKNRRTILQLKYDTPETEQIMGIEYYKAVIQDGVQTYEELIEWRKENPANRMIEWKP